MESPSFAQLVIARADRNAEGLIGAMRIVIGVVLGTTLLFLTGHLSLAQVLSSPTLAVAIVVILGFLALGVATVTIVLLRVYQPWMAWAFGLADISLVTLNLYVGTAQSGASSLLGFATPGALLFCLLFVAQTLRYRRRLQITLSIVMLLSIIIIVHADPSETAPGDNAAFLRSIFTEGANVVRIVILSLIAILASVSVWRARRMLFQIASQTEAQRNLSRFLPGTLSQNMSDAALANLRTGRTAELVIMFVDVRGFTHLSEEMGTQQTTAFLTSFRSRITKAIERHRGVIDKFIGDGALVVFGLSSSPNEGARDAIKAGDAVLKAIALWNAERRKAEEPPVEVAVVAHEGRAMASAIGDTRRLEFSVVGTTVNEASRIESFAKDHDLAFVVSGQLLDAAGDDRSSWTDAGNHILRGSQHGLKLYSRTKVPGGYGRGTR